MMNNRDTNMIESSSLGHISPTHDESLVYPVHDNIHVHDPHPHHDESLVYPVLDDIHAHDPHPHPVVGPDATSPASFYRDP